MLEECPSSTSLRVPMTVLTQLAAKVSQQDSSASTDTGSTPRIESGRDMVPTPPCARTPVKMAPPPRTLPTSVPVLPPSTPCSSRATTQVTKLLVSSGLSSTNPGTPLQTPKPTPKPTPHATPVRQ